VRITAMRFHPPHVSPGGTSVVRLQARNCTTQAQTVTVTWVGQFVGTTAGVPAGCPVIDPVAQSLSFAPRGRATASLGFTVPVSCTATTLTETARLSDTAGNVIAQKTANLTIT